MKKEPKYHVGDKLYCIYNRKVDKSTVERIIVEDGRTPCNRCFDDWGTYEYFFYITYVMSNGRKYSESELFETKEELLKSL